MRAKHRVAHRMFVATYNLFGDPAVPLVLPAGEIELRAGPAADGPLRVAGTIGLDDFGGEVLVELVNGAGEVLEAAQLVSVGTEFSLELAAVAEAAAVRAYAWDEGRGIDAAGGLGLIAEPAAPAPTARRRLNRSEGPSPHGDR